jgi:Holliday junction resolvase-like predicted endonuclease
MAASFLNSRRASVVDRNRRLGFDEIDLLVEHEGRLVAVEVKTRVDADPIEQFTGEQADRLRRAATAAGASRCDLVTVLVGSGGIEVRWILGVC